MLLLKSLAKQRLLITLETKSFLKLIRNPICNASLRIFEIKGCLSRTETSYSRCYSTDKPKDEIVKSSNTTESEVSTSTIEKVKETTKTVTYSGIIAIGLGLTGIIFYTVFNELFSAKSANSIYSKALDRCLTNEKVVLSLGEPIRAFGEENSRGRRRHTNHLLYTKDGVNHMRMKFFIKGSRKKATVHLEMKENENKNFEYRYLFVQLDEYPYTTIVLEDNRLEASSPLKQTKDGTLVLS